MAKLPSGREYLREEAPLSGTEGHWDGRGRVVVLGFLLPALLTGWVIFDLIRGETWVLRRAFAMTRFPIGAEPWVFWGISILKLSAAAVGFAIWAIGNHRQAGWHTEWIVLTFACIGTAALVMALAGAML